MRAFLILVFSPLLLAASPPLGVNLAELDGWDIVLPADPIESEVFAAEEFQHFLREAGGPDLPIVRAEDADNRHIFIGMGIDVQAFGQEDFRILVQDDSITIAGGRPRGTLYGVYTFLEDYLGVRFLTPEHTHVPQVGHWRRIAPVDRFFHPPMEVRWVGYEDNYADPKFAARLRLNWARGVPAIAVNSKDGRGAGPLGGRSSVHHVGHSFNEQLPPERYAKDHPDYYCLYKGRRWATLKPGEDGIDFKEGSFPYGMQPCLSHPDVLEIVTQRVLDEFAAHPEYLNVSVGQNDGGAHCQCPPCTEVFEREGSQSGSLLAFVNEVAEVVEKEYPDRRVSTLAYSDTVVPPKTIRPRDNVQIMWCSITTCFLHPHSDTTCPANKLQIDTLRGWGAKTKHLYAWNYLMNDENRGCQLPMPNLGLIGDNIRYQASLGVRGMWFETTSSSHGNQFEELRNYLLARLAWDPAQEVERLMTEWVTLHYGPAAPPMQAWIDRLHRRASASGLHCRCLGGKFSDYGLEESDARFGMDSIQMARRLAGDDPVLQERIDQASVWAVRAMIEPVWYLKEGDTVDPALAARMQPLVDRFFELCRKHGVTRSGYIEATAIGKDEERLRTILQGL
jgi:hypothetical protein